MYNFMTQLFNIQVMYPVGITYQSITDDEIGMYHN